MSGADTKYQQESVCSCQRFSSSLLQMFWTGHFFVVGLSCVFIRTTGIYLPNSNGTLQVVIIRKCPGRFLQCSLRVQVTPLVGEPLPYLCMKFYKFFFFESPNNSFACLFIGTWKFSTNLLFLCVSEFIDYRSFLSNKSLKNVREERNNLN